MQLTAGQLLQGGKYIVNHPLETAGFGVTYLGTQTALGQSVVLKTLHPALAKSRAFGRLRDRFIHLSCELTRCHHPNLVAVVELFQEGDWPFMAMEYISGQSFAELIKSGRPMAEMEALHYIRTIAAGLQASHRQGLVHGNLKPENLIRRASSNSGVIVGYGISAERMLAGVQYAVPGFPHAFTAPEQIGPTGDRLKSADLYGLAALLYYLLTGQPPIAATDRATLDPRQQLPQLNLIKPSLQQVIRQGLALNPQDRPSSIETWLQLLPAPSTRHTTAAPKPAVTKIPPPETQIQPRPPLTPDRSEANNRSETIAPPRPAAITPPAAPAITPPITPPPAPVPPTVVSAPLPIVAPPAPPERPKLREQPAPLPPERPKFREQPLPEPNRAAAGMSIAPPQASSRAEQQLQQRPIRPYPTQPNAPLTTERSPTGQRRWFNLKQWLIWGSSLAAVGGIAFGLVLRFSAHRAPVGGSMFDAEQSFPSRPWEGTLAPPKPEEAPIEESSSGLPPRSPSSNSTAPKAFDPAPIIESVPTDGLPDVPPVPRLTTPTAPIDTPRRLPDIPPIEPFPATKPPQSNEAPALNRTPASDPAPPQVDRPSPAIDPAPPRAESDPVPPAR